MMTDMAHTDLAELLACIRVPLVAMPTGVRL
jgi:hypothetical protein